MFSCCNHIVSNARAERSGSAGYRLASSATAKMTQDAISHKIGDDATFRFGKPPHRFAINFYSVPKTEFIEITNYPIELLMEVEHNTDIGILYSRWRHLGEPPHKNRFHPRSANAACFRVASELPMDFEYTSTDEPTQTLSIREFDNELMQNQAMDDLLLVKETCEPLYQQVIHRIGPVEGCFRRILLPAIDDEGQVELVYSATRLFGAVEPEFFEKERSWQVNVRQALKCAKRWLPSRQLTTLGQSSRAVLLEDTTDV